MKLLVVEPDMVLGKVLVHTLKQEGHEVVHKRTAQTALDGADEQPDMIILETQLGLHNGIEFLYELRSYNEWQDIPVIIHTMNSHLLEVQFSQPLKDLGVQAVLYKPQTTTKQLLATIKSVILV